MTLNVCLAQEALGEEKRKNEKKWKQACVVELGGVIFFPTMIPVGRALVPITGCIDVAFPGIVKPSVNQKKDENKKKLSITLKAMILSQKKLKK